MFRTLSRSPVSLSRIVWTLVFGAGGALLGGRPAPGAETDLGSPAHTDEFDAALALEEAGSARQSASPEWWLSSGGRFLNAGGLGMTLQGLLPQNDRWRLAYAASNPLDTEDGYRPQNIFRLVTRHQWKDLEQEVSFRIRRVNLTESPNRSRHNGVLLFHRYLDEDNLYYAGIRVDGVAVVKRKQGGVYTTLGSSPVYPGSYDRMLNPSLIPLERWIGLRTAVADLAGGGGVGIKVEVNDPAAAAGWVRALEVVDPVGSAILTAGFTGIRTDFADVEFEGYRAAGQPCDSSISPSRRSFSAAGGEGTVSVSAPAGCTWRAASSADWIGLLAASGAGVGAATYIVAPNAGSASRSGTLLLAGQTFTVTQEGAPAPAPDSPPRAPTNLRVTRVTAGG